MKPTTHLKPLLPLSTQLHLLNLFAGDETPYESLHAAVSCGFKPWFDTLSGPEQGRGTTQEGEGEVERPSWGC